MTTTPAIAAQPKGEAWQSMSAEDVLTKLGSAATGLSAQEAAKRLAADGPNELKAHVLPDSNLLSARFPSSPTH
jgi:hypothetical protein